MFNLEHLNETRISLPISFVERDFLTGDERGRLGLLIHIPRTTRGKEFKEKIEDLRKAVAEKYSRAIEDVRNPLKENESGFTFNTRTRLVPKVFFEMVAETGTTNEQVDLKTLFQKVPISGNEIKAEFQPILTFNKQEIILSLRLTELTVRFYEGVPVKRTLWQDFKNLFVG